MKTYRIIVGPYVTVEFTVHYSMTRDEEARLLGLYLIDACVLGNEKYGPSHEVRVQLYKRTGPA